MSYIGKKRMIRNVGSIIFFLIIEILFFFFLNGLYINGFGFTGDQRYINQILIPILLFGVMFLIGIVIALIAYNKDGILITLFSSVIYGLTILITFFILNYDQLIVIYDDILLIVEIPIGIVISILGAILGCYIKSKITKTFDMPQWKKIWNFILE
ncbi:MAG: hypothetical protein FK733_07625 [Asgard group archaeon]|nr:hypothetical protein [Asgard group archaeon]